MFCHYQQTLRVCYHRGKKIAKLILFEVKLAFSLLSYLRFSDKLIPGVYFS